MADDGLQCSKCGAKLELYQDRCYSCGATVTNWRRKLLGMRLDNIDYENPSFVDSLKLTVLGFVRILEVAIVLGVLGGVGYLIYWLFFRE